MALLETNLFTFLTGASAVSAIVGNRVYAKKLPPGCKLPAISYFIVTTDFQQDLEGEGDTINVRLQIDCWALDNEKVKLLAKAVRSAMTSATLEANGFVALCQNAADNDDDAANYYGASLDFSVWHEED